MACWPEGKVPIDSGEARLHVDHMQATFRRNMHRPCLTGSEPAMRRRPFNRAAPVKRLHDVKCFAVLPPFAPCLQYSSGRASLECFIEVEIVSVLLVAFAVRYRHAAVEMVGRDPEGVVMRMVGRMLRRHRVTVRREQRIDVGAMPALG